jgi:excinuclease UvrABC nuclease subunit
VDMVTKARILTWNQTQSVLEAILLESALIKRYQPFYNVDERDDKSAQYVIITDEPWPRVFLARARDFEQGKNEGTLSFKVKKQFGPYLESGLIKESLKILRRLFPFRDKKAHDPRHESFYRAIGQSPDDSDSQARKNYLRTIRYLSLFFEGNSKGVRLLIEREMKRNAKSLRFEEAGKNRQLLYALDHINDIALIKRAFNGTYGAGGNGSAGSSKRPFRMEAYDVAHLSGTNVVGAMTVSIIPVVAVTKDDKHKAADVIGLMELVKAYRRDIIAVNAEAHRFAVRYHRQRRGAVLA